MFGRAIWDKLPEYILENFDIALVKQAPKIAGTNHVMTADRNKPISTLYWNQYLLAASSYKSASGQLQKSGQLQNNVVNGEMAITVNCVIRIQIRARAVNSVFIL